MITVKYLEKRLEAVIETRKKMPEAHQDWQQYWARLEVGYRNMIDILKSMPEDTPLGPE